MAARGGCVLLFLFLFSFLLDNAAAGHLTDGDSRRSSRGIQYSIGGGGRGGGRGGGGRGEDGEDHIDPEIRLMGRKRRDVEITTSTTSPPPPPPPPPSTPPPNNKKKEEKENYLKNSSKKKPIYTKKATPTITTTITAVSTTATTSTTTTTTTTAPSTGVDDGFAEDAAGDDGDENRTGNVDVMDTTTTSTTTTTTTSTTPPPPVPAVEKEVEEEDEEEEEGGEDMEEDSVEPVQGFVTTNATVDHHRYYRSHTIKGIEEVQHYWVDLDSIEREEVITNEMLSASHRRAATVTLTFPFPFYGHLLRNITIATGGFLFTGEFVHTWLAATQYIAPLMANFDTSMSKNASVKYADNGTSFTVQWNNVPLKDHADAGTFTFQVTLHKNGDIVFTYKQVPMFVTAIIDDQHPVKVGLSDAYIVDRTIFFVRRKTIYEYHKIDMKKKNMIGNWTAILFKALPTCVSMHTCDACLSQKISFQCQWCDSIGRCSNGLDRNRQEWLLNSCETHHTQLAESCPPAPPGSPQGEDSYPETFGGDAAVESFTAGSSSNTNTTREGGRENSSTSSSSSSPLPLPPPYEYENSSSSSSPSSKPPMNPTPSPSSSSSSSLAGTEERGEQDRQTQALRDKEGGDGGGGGSVGVVIGVVFLVTLLMALGWVSYAYFYPHSTSGQLLIKYRPSTWSWRSGEARYTAAAIHSIHM